MNNVFGTDGIRGRVGSGIFVDHLLEHVGRALAHWAVQQYHRPRILIAHDTRESAHALKKHLLKGALQEAVHVVDAAVLPTPAAYSILKRSTLFDCAIVITASHNPYHDNGIKIFDSTTVKLSVAQEEYISSLIGNLSPQQRQGSYEVYRNALAHYQKSILAHFQQNFLHDMTVVLDTAHGATYLVAPALFTALGAHVHTIHNQPTGRNINDTCGSTHPAALQQAVVAYDADLGFAFDGDGDRVIAVNSRGEIKDGDDLLALLAMSPTYRHEKTVVGTIMSNEGLNPFLKHWGKELVRAGVGDKKVYEKLQEHGALLGGESSGHVIIRDYLPTADGIFTALKIAQTLIETENMRMETFDKFPQELINIEVATQKSLDQEPLRTLIEEAQARLTPGRVIVRYSGTQNILRIMAEAPDKHLTHKIAHELAEKLNGVINS